MSKNPFFEKAKRQAKKISDQPEKVRKVIDEAISRTKVLDETKDKARTLRNQLESLFQMLKASIKGEYKSLPKTTFIKILGAVIYFLFITDLIPDFIAVIGLFDDAAVVAWVIKSISKDIDAFNDWTKRKEESIKEKKPINLVN